jgi:RNA polymerase sigma factor (sigma-70 family)
VARARHGATLRQIQTLFNVGTVGGLTDGQLLERFTAGTGEAAELAFAALIERHGPMVLRVCQSVLREPHDAQDAFQATFLVLVRKAGSIRKRDSLSSWLHGVACRIAACAQAATARRARHERKAAAGAASVVADRDPDDLASVLHEELDRLPEKYRAPIVLCYLESLTHEQAAQRLRWPVGTVRSRLARGREQLRGRLTRRGLALSVGLLEGALVAETARAALPATLAGVTAEAAVRYASGRLVATGVASAAVAFLAEGAMKTMFVAKWKFALLAAGLLAAGAVAVAQRVGTENAAAAEDAAVARELRRLDLELLTEEVQQLRDQVGVAFRAKLRAEKRNQGKVGEGPATQAEGVKEAQRAYEEARAAYLARARELRSERRRLAVAPAPAIVWPLELEGSTMIIPDRIARIKPRFGAARVVEIGRVWEHLLNTGLSKDRELKAGDKVAKGDLLAVFSSAEVGNTKKDLLDALVQLELDQQILNRIEKNRHAVPEATRLTQSRQVQHDRNAITRVIKQLKTWDIPQAEIDAIQEDARKIHANKDEWERMPEGRWVRREKQAKGGKVDSHKEAESDWGRVTLRAPFDGVILEENVAVGEMVTDPTINLFQIANLSRLLVAVHCPEDALPTLSSLRPDQRRWTVHTAFAPPEGIPGTIDEIGYLIDPNQHTAIIKGYIENPGQKIRGSQFVTATVNGP